MDPWLIVDPRFVDSAERAVAQAVMTMVRSNWQELPELNVTDPVVQGVLRRHRIATLVPTDAVPESARHRFREELQSAYVTQMRLQAAAIEVCTALTEAGIEHRVLKGLASAFLDYPRPELRQTGDVDLAVRPVALDAVETVLAQLGATLLPGSRAGHLLKGTTWRTSNGLEIDVHTRLFVRSQASDQVFAAAGEPVAEVQSSACESELRLVHAAGRFLGSPVAARRMSGLIDTVRLLDQDPDHLVVRSLAQQHGVEALVGESLRVCLRLASRPQWPELMDWRALAWFDRRLLLSDHRRWAFEYIGRMRSVAPRDRLAYLPTWLVPRREAVRKAKADISGRLRRG